MHAVQLHIFLDGSPFCFHSEIGHVMKREMERRKRVKAVSGEGGHSDSEERCCFFPHLHHPLFSGSKRIESAGGNEETR